MTTPYGPIEGHIVHWGSASFEVFGNEDVGRQAAQAIGLSRPNGFMEVFGDHRFEFESPEEAAMALGQLAEMGYMIEDISQQEDVVAA